MENHRGTAPVSVVLVTYDAAWCVVRALDSVFAQTIRPAEVIVCDDGSSDGTPELLEAQYAGSVRVLRLPHRNAAVSRRKGLALARMPWVAFLDADDWWAPTKLERQMAWLEQRPQVRWLATDGEYVSARGVLLSSWLSKYFRPVRDSEGDFFALLVQRCFPLVSSILIDRACYEEVGGLDEELPYSHDYDLWLRLASRHPGGVMAEKLVSYWCNPDGLSACYEGRYADDLKILQRVASGAIGGSQQVRRMAAERASARALQLGMWCLRCKQMENAHVYFKHASMQGPWWRRVVATLCARVPHRAIGYLRRSSLLRRLAVVVRS